MTITCITGKGDLPMLQVSNAHADALISVYAGQVLSYIPKGNSDLLFVSDHAYFATGKAIKGGVPICWPWFGNHPTSGPAHGFVRSTLWQVRETTDLADGASRIVLGITDSPATRAFWDYAFELAVEITVGATLQVALVTRNTDSRAMQITQGLHTYFAVADIARTQVAGLDGIRYLDKARGAQDGAHRQYANVTFSQEVNRIYLDVPATLTLLDGQRSVRITSVGNKTAVIWNPWAEVAAEMADLCDDAYQRFVCVETTNAADDVITIPAGGEYRLSAEYALL
ncbi:MAG: D-hexose-6-phosphate mutarotase [Thiothrix sp.]